MPFSVVDIFCGAGGLSYGFAKNPGFSIKLAVDIDGDAAKTYALNHKTRVLNQDLASLGESTLLELGGIDLLLGGPPCQSYSTLGKRRFDSKARLFEEFLRVLGILSPSLFIFENVTGLLSMQGGRLFRLICERFYEAGYRLEFRILNALHFGVPQIRERVILVGRHNDLDTSFAFPSPTHVDNDAFVTLKDALDDLPCIQSGENGDLKGYRFEANNDFLDFVRTSECLSEHVSPKNNSSLVRIMQTLKDGESKDDLPPDMRPKSGYANTYAKLWWNRPSTTITRNFSTPSSSRCIHPRDSRALSIREGARLQSFPDDYLFVGSNNSKRLQIGNAVPPLLSVALANAVLGYFNKLCKESQYVQI